MVALETAVVGTEEEVKVVAERMEVASEVEALGKVVVKKLVVVVLQHLN